MSALTPKGDRPDPEEDFAGFVKSVADDVIGEMEQNPEPEYWIAKAAARVLKAKRMNFPASITERFEKTLRERVAKYAASERSAHWIPVSVRVPTHEYTVLLFVTKAEGFAGSFRDLGIYNTKTGKFQICHGDDDIEVEASHWADLPDDPPAVARKPKEGHK